MAGHLEWSVPGLGLGGGVNNGHIMECGLRSCRLHLVGNSLSLAVSCGGFQLIAIFKDAAREYQLQKWIPASSADHWKNSGLSFRPRVHLSCATLS